MSTYRLVNFSRDNVLLHNCGTDKLISTFFTARLHATGILATSLCLYVYLSVWLSHAGVKTTIN